MSVAVRRRFAVLANPAWVCFVWFGMTAGISLLATPVRFGAPLMTREVGLDVARVVFSALNRAELVALVLLLIVIRLSGRAARWWAVGGVLTLIVLAQSAWLLPELAARTELVVSGIEPPPSHLHATYSVLELGKLGILLMAGFAALAEGRAGPTSVAD
ncbi:MAG: hypothetical protein R3288_08570 [Woeseiaceae bacterium]|nr:hypothetical protein [Woeseiaceae bacterium]